MEKNYFGTADLVVFLGKACCVTKRLRHFDDLQSEARLTTIHSYLWKVVAICNYAT